MYIPERLALYCAVQVASCGFSVIGRGQSERQYFYRRVSSFVLGMEMYRFAGFFDHRSCSMDQKIHLAAQYHPSGMDDLQFAGQDFKCKVFPFEADELPVCMSREGHVV